MDFQTIACTIAIIFVAVMTTFVLNKTEKLYNQKNNLDK